MSDNGMKIKMLIENTVNETVLKLKKSRNDERKSKVNF